MQQQAPRAAPAALRRGACRPRQLGRRGLQQALQQQQAVVRLLPAWRGGKQILLLPKLCLCCCLCRLLILLRPRLKHVSQLRQQAGHPPGKASTLHLG